MTSLTYNACKTDLVIAVREDCLLQGGAYKGFQTDADWMSTNQRAQNINENPLPERRSIHGIFEKLRKNFHQD